MCSPSPSYGPLFSLRFISQQATSFDRDTPLGLAFSQGSIVSPQGNTLGDLPSLVLLGLVSLPHFPSRFPKLFLTVPDGT